MAFSSLRSAEAPIVEANSSKALLAEVVSKVGPMTHVRIQAMKHEYYGTRFTLSCKSVSLQLNFLILFSHMKIYETILGELAGSLRIGFSELLRLLCLKNPLLLYFVAQLPVAIIAGVVAPHAHTILLFY